MKALNKITLVLSIALLGASALQAMQGNPNSSEAKKKANLKEAQIRLDEIIKLITQGMPERLKELRKTDPVSYKQLLQAQIAGLRQLKGIKLTQREIEAILKSL